MSLLWFQNILLLVGYLKLQIHDCFLCSCSSAARGTGSAGFLKHLHFVRVSVFSALQLAEWRSQGFWYIILLTASLWFLRFYLHYLSQWLFLQAISIPVTKWVLSPASQRDAFSSWSAKWKCKTPLRPFTGRPKMWVWFEETKMSLSESKNVDYSYSLILWACIYKYITGTSIFI